MQKLIAWLMTLAVSIILVTVLALHGVYFTTLLTLVTFANAVTYYTTLYVLNELKKTETCANK
ncbi:hypothetical protein [Staphylococcus felis]|uniref:hypothetical protein n=1 Tax=Staphylococcus felis TaxID=46127 RepID=UPI000E28BE2F|nr:hypothetical protein [Staphylococcus felis]REI16784.1 hypothetical protein DOS73_02655 [Staphylococcus felis]